MMNECGSAMNFYHNPTISVLIPYHRVDAYLYRSVNSVTSQTFCPYEIILINDGCSEQIDLNRFLDSKIKLKQVFIEKNSGPAAARNLGFRAAKGNFI